MMSLQFRMGVLIALLFAVIYTLVVLFGTAMGMHSFSFYLFFSFMLMFVQFMIGPKIVEWSMRIKYVSRGEYPQLYDMIEDQSRKAKIAMPRGCVS
ncbi:MAG: hypothetical protein KC713_02390 [Candidatus Omnitrophica bacterium]|nr:hypothetical protein [Candidatus Omnitrophota bacterium]